MNIKKWAPATWEAYKQLKAAGATECYGYFNLLQLAVGSDNTLTTNVRELAELFDLADFRAVKRVLKVLAAAKLIEFSQNARGTKIRLLEAVSVEETTTPALRKPQHSVEETSTPVLFPPDPPNPVDVAFIYKQQNGINNNITPPKGEAALFDVPPFGANGFAKVKGKDAGTFRAPLTDKASPRDIFAVWYVETIWPDLYATATKGNTSAWHRRNGRALSSVITDCADSDVKLAKEVTLACKARRDANPFFKGEPPSLEYIAGSWHQDLRTVMTARRAKAEQARLQEQLEAKRRAEAEENKKLEQEYLNTLTEDELRQYLRAEAEAAKKGG